MTADGYTKVEADGVFLPSPEGGEKYTQLDCPDCEIGEVRIVKDAIHRCRSCGT